MSAVQKVNLFWFALMLALMFGYAQAVHGVSPTAHMYAVASTNDQVINQKKPRPTGQKKRDAAKLYKFKPKQSIKADTEISLPADI